MSDSETKRKPKGSKVNKIASLFEIPRPAKGKGLQRTNSLPASRKSNEDDRSSTSSGTSLRGYYGSAGKVQRIRKNIEEQNEQKYAHLKQKTSKKRSKSHRDYFCDEEKADWLNNKEKIMADNKKLREKIQEVSFEIQNSDTELEITYADIMYNDNNNAIESDKNCDNNCILNSNDNVNRQSQLVLGTTSEDDDTKEPYVLNADSDDSINRLSCSAFINGELVNEKVIDFKDADFECVEADSYKKENELKNFSESDYTIENEPELEDSVFQETEEPTHVQNANETEVDSIDFWKHKSFVQVNIDDSTKQVEEENAQSIDKGELAQSSTIEGRFKKNHRLSKRNRRSERRRTGLLKKPFSVQELAMKFEGFRDAAEQGETENFRKSFISEMDLELENMKNDGFCEDFYLSFDNLNLLHHVEVETGKGECKDNDLKQEDDPETPSFQTIIIFPTDENQQDIYANLYGEDDDDLFGETQFSENLERGLYYLETYNADGKELIKCSVQIDRQSVDMNNLEDMRARSASNIIVDDEKALVLIEGADKVSLNDSNNGNDSKRTTMYSTTSGDSYEDEGIDIENASNAYGYSAARRETYCDDQGVVRIERVVPYPSASGTEDRSDYVSTVNNYYYSSQNHEVSNIEENYYETVRLGSEMPEIKKDTLQYILEEIVSTERKYVSDLRKVLSEYKTFLEQRCQEKVVVVFANMELLYRKQYQFLQALDESEMEVTDVIQAFIDFEDLFQIYPKYFENTPKANAAVKELSYLIKEKQDKINDKLDLSAYLLTPLQRLGKYKLFLENIVKQLAKEEKNTFAAQMALEIIKKYMSKGNDAVAIASISGSPLHPKDYGSFITREKFMQLKPKRLELMVFLFDKAIVFTSEDPKNMEQFIYQQSIKTNDLRIATFDDTNNIHLTDYTKTKRRNSSKYTYVLDAKNPKLKAAWKQQIEEILWKQMKKIKENTLKEYKSGTITPRRPQKSREQRSKSTGSSIFYVE